VSLWDHLPASELQPDDESARLIAEKTTSAGLARPQLARTLMEIRALPETEETTG
jgi:hypothetical protein